jgi:glyoxylase-like metal-dependent hydrolase (beta-lactamase superfamily II)
MEKSMLEIIPLVLGPVATNAYLVGEKNSHSAVVIDPAWDGALIADEAKRRGWQIKQIWLTHAHFDHIGGVAALMKSVQPAPSIALHSSDLALYRAQGGAALFGIRVEQSPEPTVPLKHGQMLRLGDRTFEVRHTPGHTPGHVIFYCAAEKLVFCGDVIFWGSIGRTDLPGGSYDTLMQSVHLQILSLANDTRILSGHGGETSVGVERRENPFLS